VASENEKHCVPRKDFWRRRGEAASEQCEILVVGFEICQIQNLSSCLCGEQERVAVVSLISI
jgi:hypothetical protein